jgi:hypothetical protein
MITFTNDPRPSWPRLHVALGLSNPVWRVGAELLRGLSAGELAEDNL